MDLRPKERPLDLDPEELAELVALKRCRLTRWAAKFLEDYNTVEKLGGTEAQGCLLASAQGYRKPPDTIRGICIMVRS